MLFLLLANTKVSGNKKLLRLTTKISQLLDMAEVVLSITLANYVTPIMGNCGKINKAKRSAK